MSSSSFILEIKLNTTDHDERVLNERFFHGFLMYNKLVSRARKCLKGLRQDKRYRALIEQYSKAKTKPEQKLLYPELNVLRLEYGLSEYQFHHWISVQQKKNKKFIDSNTAQKIATRVWRAVEEFLVDGTVDLVPTNFVGLRTGKSIIVIYRHPITLVPDISFENLQNPWMKVQGCSLRQKFLSVVREAPAHYLC